MPPKATEKETGYNNHEVSLPSTSIPTTPPTSATYYQQTSLKTEFLNNVEGAILSNPIGCDFKDSKNGMLTRCKESKLGVKEKEEDALNVADASTPDANDLILHFSGLPQAPFATVPTSEVNLQGSSKIPSNELLPTSQIVYIKPFSKPKTSLHQKPEQSVIPSIVNAPSTKEKKIAKVETSTPSRIIYISLVTRPTKSPL